MEDSGGIYMREGMKKARKKMEQWMEDKKEGVGESHNHREGF